MHGYGIFDYLDGRKYIGNYVNGKREGFGSYEDGKGNIVKGEWFQGVKHGEITQIN